MLAGRPPFLGTSPISILYQQLHSKPANIRNFNPSIPPAMAQIIEAALAKKSEDRYSSAELFARALMPFTDELPQSMYAP